MWSYYDVIIVCTADAEKERWKQKEREGERDWINVDEAILSAGVCFFISLSLLH